MTKSTENKNIAKILYKGYFDAKNSEEKNHVVKSFLQTISRKRLEKRLGEIMGELEKLHDKDTGTITANLTTKERLSPHTLLSVRKFVEKKYSAKETRVTERVDERVLGGIKIKVGDEIFDSTLARSLKELSLKLKV
jgi:F-type H+-transporting ATPase subunit delta